MYVFLERKKNSAQGYVMPVKVQNLNPSPAEPGYTLPLQPV